MANWIKLFPDVDRNREYKAYEDSMREGKKGARRKRDAEDIAFARVVRLYLLLGQTKDGRIDMKEKGDRLLAEEFMRESGDELYTILDAMAVHGIISRDLWAALNVVTTSGAVEQAELRQFYKDRSRAGNDAKRRKAKGKGENRSGEP